MFYETQLSILNEVNLTLKSYLVNFLLSKKKKKRKNSSFYILFSNNPVVVYVLKDMYSETK